MACRLHPGLLISIVVTKYFSINGVLFGNQAILLFALYSKQAEGQN